ncbi:MULTISPECIES: sensor histidine kinase [Selenomonas]|uniref:histidine kinase n=1 Tax=Selenomonas ruminantium TaxID=971 RepID=A0A1H3WI91_SELRU|nr:MULTISPECIES: sensor histidine kinase [Selenomonas]SDZ86052.1 two-component system, NarL family, sensor histidine kinase DegS [Selenomonas ruminantium]
MADQQSGSLPPDMGGLQAQSLKKILSNTISTIEDNKSQIFEIYETARSEVESSRKLLEDLREQTRQTIERVDGLSKQEQQEKQKLVKVSSNFQDYSEEKVRECYESVKNVQVSLGVEREKEANLRAQRDKLELRLRNLQTMLAQAEHLALAVGSVLSYLSTQVNGVIWKIEAVQKEKFVGARIIKAQEEERYRISREMHDGPAQDLANIIFQTSIAEKLVDYDPDEAKRTLQEMRQQMRDCLGSVREVIFDMRPMALDDLGLVAALNQLIGRLASRGTLAIDFSMDGKVYELPKHVEIAIFRIVQEALNNIYHHADVKQAKVRLLYSPAAVSALIEDNGKGFDPDAKDEVQNADEDTEDVVETNHHFGLMGMQERAKIIGAELNITSAIGEGTRVHLRVPLHEPVQEAKDVKVVKTPAKKKGKGR